MDINASVIAAQTATARQNATLGFAKSNATADQQIASVLSEAAVNAASASGGGRGSIVDILA